MRAKFLVLTAEIVQVEEHDFLTHGGQELHFGSVAGDTVSMYAVGSPDSIGRLARTIRAHHTAAPVAAHAA